MWKSTLRKYGPPLCLVALCIIVLSQLAGPFSNQDVPNYKRDFRGSISIDVNVRVTDDNNNEHISEENIEQEHKEISNATENSVIPSDRVTPPEDDATEESKIIFPKDMNPDMPRLPPELPDGNAQEQNKNDPISLNPITKPESSSSEDDIFDPNLLNIREKVVKIIRSSDYKDKFQNPDGVYTSLKEDYPMPEITSEMMGKLNVYVWWEFCSLYVEALRGLAGFPYNPPTKLYTDKLFISRGVQAYGQRIFGYIIPPRTGLYRFAISSDDCSELWLSYDHDPRHSEKIAYLGYYGQNMMKLWASPGEFTKDQNQQSLLTRLIQGKPYYMEILHVNSAGDDHVQVSWLVPGNVEYEVISSNCMAAFIIDPEDKIVAETYHPKFALPMHNEHLVTTEYSRNDREGFLKLPFFPAKFFEGTFSSCEYAPSFAVPHEVKRYMGVYEVRQLSIYPNDQTDVMNVDDKSYGNPLVEESEVNAVLDILTRKIKESLPDVKLMSLVNFEKSEDPAKGTRYLIECKIKLNGTSSKIFRISEYLYRQNDDLDNLCYPIGLRWSKKTFVHIVITVKNQGRWIRIFVENMERIQEETKDEDFGIILIDFDSTDIDLEVLLRQSKLKNWILLRMSGSFIKVQAQNAAIDIVKNHNEIVFTCDLHLDIPSDLIEVIRKHTFKGRSGYAPALTRLQCGHTIQNPLGFWEVHGYGLYSFFKPDWMMISGMNTQDFSDSWGGEDWDLVDRVLSHGYEIERLKHKGLYHFYHSRHGMWNNN